MKKIDTYIIEKLIIDKDIVKENESIIYDTISHIFQLDNRELEDKLNTWQNQFGFNKEKINIYYDNKQYFDKYLDSKKYIDKSKIERDFKNIPRTIGDVMEDKLMKRKVLYDKTWLNIETLNNYVLCEYNINPIFFHIMFEITK